MVEGGTARRFFAIDHPPMPVPPFFAQAAINVVALLACGSVLEPLWGTPEWLRFLVVVDVAASAGTLLVLLVAYAADVSAHGAGKLL